MSSTRFIWCLLLIPFFCTALPGGEEFRCSVHGELRRTPNILLILADDLGKYDLSVYGGKLVETPHIDRLARNGALFRQGYAMAAVCSPSRMALLSGQYPQRFGYDFQPHQRYPRDGLQRWLARRLMAGDGWIPERHAQRVPGHKSARRHGIPTHAFTIAERLKDRGYRTGLFGKWHLGYSSLHHPLQHGFDSFYGFLEAYSLYARKKAPGIVNAPVPLYADKVQWKKRRGATAILRGETPVPESRYLTDAIAEEGIAFMQPQNNQPFFAMLSFSAPHAPWQAPGSLYDSLNHIADHHLRVYAAMVLSLDRAVGRVLAHIEDNGLMDHTLIVFTSDNGIAAYNGHLDPAPHRGGKFSFFEGGINVPMLMCWPGVINAGQTVDRISCHLDLAATMAAAAGADTADRMDGLNLLPMLEKDGLTIPPQPLFWRAGYNRAVRAEQYKAVIDDSTQTIFLYDLATDPGEQNNRVKELQEITKALQSDLLKWEQHMLPPAWPHVINYRMVVDGQTVFFGI